MQKQAVKSLAQIMSLRRMKWKPSNRRRRCGRSGTDVLVEVPALEKTWKFLLQEIERLFEIAVGTPEVFQFTL